jgi:hypothetical protein
VPSGGPASLTITMPRGKQIRSTSQSQSQSQSPNRNQKFLLTDAEREKEYEITIAQAQVFGTFKDMADSASPEDEPVVLDESPEDFELMMGWLFRSPEFTITKGSSK